MEQMVIQRSRDFLVDFSVATGKDYLPNWHHKEIAKELEYLVAHGDASYKILILSVPPRHGKSQECTIDFPAWVLGKKPEAEIITASYSATLAEDFGAKTREKVQTPQYKKIFPNIELKEDEQARGKWRTNKGGAYLAVGVGGAVTGMGADFAIVDDPIKNREEAESKTMRDKVWDWFTSTLFTRLSPHGVVIIIHTRWHEDDLTGRILAEPERFPRVKVIKFPAIAEQYDGFRHEGEALWANRYSLSSLEEIKRSIGAYDWAALYQGSPVNPESQEFRKDMFQYRTEEEVSQLRTNRYLTIDTAISQRDSADYTGFCDNRVDSRSKWNIRAWHQRISPKDLIDMLFTLHANNNYNAIGIEKTIYLQVIQPFLQEEMAKRNRYLPIVELEHRGVHKETRIRSLLPRYGNRGVYHVIGVCTDAEDELLRFPFAPHDDIADAIAYQTQIAEPPNTDELEMYRARTTQINKTNPAR